MTYQQIFVQIISEVSGKSLGEITELLNIMRKTHPGGNWDKEIPEDESAALITKLRLEAPGIMA